MKPAEAHELVDLTRGRLGAAAPKVLPNVA